MLKAHFKNNTLVYLTFLVALIVRLYIVYSSVSHTEYIDLNIYRDGGQLINNGINPYDYKDGVEIRNQLRLDKFSFTSWVSETQERWDFYASGNLPLSLYFYAFIDKVSGGSALVYRLFFALTDSILSALIALMLITYGNFKKSTFNLFFILGLGALSPCLILWGTVVPEDKGMQILLMLLAIYYAKEKNWMLSSILLGFSIAFKGLGVFVLPICLFFIAEEPKNILKIKWPIIKKSLQYLVLTFISAMVWVFPFVVDIYAMTKKRMAMNMGSEVIPEHGSIWKLLMDFSPNNWGIMKDGIIVFLLLLWGWGLLRGKVNLIGFSLFILVFFVDILLVAGSMDRMNIGLIVSIVCFYFIDVKYAKILTVYTIFGGLFFYMTLLRVRGINEVVDTKYLTGYLVLFCLYPLYSFLRSKRGGLNNSLTING